MAQRGRSQVPALFTQPRLFYGVWIPVLVLAILASAIRILTLDDLPGWFRFLSIALVAFAVALPILRARFRPRSG